MMKKCGRPHRFTVRVSVRSTPYGAAPPPQRTPAASPTIFHPRASPPNSIFPARSTLFEVLGNLAGKLEKNGLAGDGKWSGKLLEFAGVEARPRAAPYGRKSVAENPCSDVSPPQRPPATSPITFPPWRVRRIPVFRRDHPKLQTKSISSENWNSADSPERKSDRGRCWGGGAASSEPYGGERRQVRTLKVCGRLSLIPTVYIYIQSVLDTDVRTALKCGRPSVRHRTVPARARLHPSVPDHFPSPASPPNSSFPARSPKTSNKVNLAGKLEFGGLAEDGKWSRKLLESAGVEARPRRCRTVARPHF
ncbi:hypothetical protein ACLB2K_002255 [Fragaria x ananassa]